MASTHVVWGVGLGDADGLQALLTQICQQETALACHLAERARAVRFGPHRLSAASPARRPGALTATKLIRDLEEAEELYALYRQASRLTSDGILRSKLEGLATEEARGSQTIHGILARMDSYVMDLQ